MATLLGRFQQLAKPATDWTVADPVLLLGELGIADPGTALPIIKCGDGVRPFSALPEISGSGGGGGAPEYVAGPVTTLPPGSPASVVIDNAADPPTISFGIPTGATGTTGAPGPANSLAIGTVTTGAPGSIAAASITGTPPAQTLNLTIPQGATGATGPTGPPGPSNFANPSNPIGLNVFNGSATTAMRSDATPALSQAIAPVWTDTHVFQKDSGQIVLRNTTAAVDAKNTLFRVGTSGNFAISSSQDATPATAIRDLLAATRNLHQWTRLDLGNDWEDLAFHFLGLGLTTFHGSIVVGAPTGGNKGVGTINATGLYVNNVAVATGSMPAGANPTATIGLTAVNGSAITFMRSDGAPALSQAIVPTWTGAHTFNGAVDLAGILKAAGAEGAQGQVLASQGTGLPAVWRNAGSGSIDMTFKFSTAVGGADPGNQFFSLNSAVYSAVTSIQFDEQTSTNFEAATILSLLRVGNRIYLQQTDDATRAAVYEVTAPGTDQGTYWTIPVSFIATTATPTMFAANKVVAAVFILSSSSIAVANPSATIGLTAVNGSLATAMRSDAAPALSQAIAPTWSAVHNWGTSGTIQSNATMGARGRVNAFEWGHTNAAGYANTLGYNSTNGRGFLAFNAEAGTTANLFRTRGIIGRILQADVLGGLLIGRAATATADDQTLTIDVTVAADGGLVMAAATGGSKGAGTINATGLYINNVAVSAGADSVGANPSASVGLTAVNGSATTWMRSDAAPALSQAIAPTWTAQHIFTSTANGGAVRVSSAAPQYGFTETDGATDAKEWRWLVNGGSLRGQTTDDAVSLFRDFLIVSRTGAAITSVSFGNVTDNPTYTFSGTGAGSVSGTWTFTLAPVVPNASWTYAKIQNVSATSRVLGRITAGAGVIEELTGANLATILGSAIPAGANPSASGGLTAVNGSATTFMRSDGAPALSQAIAPTWSAAHTFTSVVSALGGPINLVSAQPGIYYGETDQAADSKAWIDYLSSGIRQFTIWNDAGSVAKLWLGVTRAANVITNVAFGNATDNPTYSFTGTGLATISGALVMGAASGGSMGTGTVNATGLYVNGVAVGGSVSGANPSASVGLTAVNGSASTFMRSDGAPALSQAILPTWTGQHIFESASPLQIILRNTAAGSNAKNTALNVNTAGGFYIYSASDASPGSLVTALLNGIRSGSAWSNLVLGNSTDNTIVSMPGTGGLVVTGAASAASFTSTSSRAIKRETGAPAKPASILARLRPILYRLLMGDDREQLGLVAEEVRDICPQLSDGKTVAYDRLAILLLAAWQDEHSAQAA